MKKINLFLSTLLAVTFLGVSALALAQDNFPSKPITIVVPYPPGGSNDVFARNIAKDLAPVAIFADGPFIVTVNNSFAAKTPAELIAAIRKNPGKFNYATSGTGSVNQFGTELLKAKAGNLFITHIPYRGMGPAVTDLISGQVQVLIASGPSLLPMVRAGRIRAVGITSLKPSPIAPDLTPMSSAVTGYEFALWWGLLAPAGTPAPVVAKLNAAVNQVLTKPTIKAQFLAEGAEVKMMTSAQFGTIVSNDIALWKKLAKQQNIVAE